MFLISIIVISFFQHEWYHIFYCSSVQWSVFSLFELVIIFDCLISYSNVRLFVFDSLLTVSFKQISARPTVNLLKPNSLLQLLRSDFSPTKTQKNKGNSQHSQKFSRIRVIIPVNSLTDFETGFWFCITSQYLHMQISGGSLNWKCYCHHYR